MVSLFTLLSVSLLTHVCPGCENFHFYIFFQMNTHSSDATYVVLLLSFVYLKIQVHILFWNPQTHMASQRSICNNGIPFLGWIRYQTIKWTLLSIGKGSQGPSVQLIITHLVENQGDALKLVELRNPNSWRWIYAIAWQNTWNWLTENEHFYGQKHVKHLLMLKWLNSQNSKE